MRVHACLSRVQISRVWSSRPESSSAQISGAISRAKIARVRRATPPAAGAARSVVGVGVWGRLVGVRGRLVGVRQERESLRHSRSAGGWRDDSVGGQVVDEFKAAVGAWGLWFVGWLEARPGPHTHSSGSRRV